MTATAATYSIKYNRSTNHISGLDIRSTGSQMNYALSSCGALSRSYNFATTGTSTDLAKVLKDARLGSRKICKTCEAAAEHMLAN